MKNLILLINLFLSIILFGQSKQRIDLNGNEDKLEIIQKNYQGLDLFFFG